MDINILVQSALGEKTGIVYLSLLELGQTSMVQLAQKAQLPRATCYLVLEELDRLGLVGRTTSGKRTILSAAEPAQLLRVLSDRTAQTTQIAEQLAEAMPALEAINNSNHDKPAVRFFSGLEGIKTILEETLSAPEIMVLCSGYEKPLAAELERYLDDYFERVAQRGIVTRELIGDAADAVSYQQQYDSDLHQIRLVPYSADLEHIDKLIYGDSVATISYERRNGVVVDNGPMAAYERELFEKIWNG